MADNHNIYETIEQLQKDIKTLERAVYSGSTNLNNEINNTDKSLDPNSEDVLTRHLLKLTEIETQFQNLTNRFEEINFKLDKLSNRLSKVQADNQIRFQDLETSVFSDENQNQRSLKNIGSSSLSSQLDFGFDRVQMVGLNGNLARGDFLLKYEAANITGASFLKINPADLPGSKKNQNVLGFGFDYSGVNNLILGYETNLRSILNHTNDLIVSKSSIGHALQARWSGINDTININANLNRFEGEKSTIASLVTSYKPRDGLTLFARYVQYDAFEITDTLYPYKKQDVIMLSSEYSF